MPKNAAQPVVRPPAELNGVIFRKLLPLLIGAYVISFLDRTNIGIAKEQLQVDLGISATAYGIGAGLFFITYSLAEIPSNLVLHRVGARFWITRIMIIWGLVSAGMAFVQGEWSFYIMRMLLGAAEAGLFPGVMYYLTQWFTRADRAKANGLFLLGCPRPTSSVRRWAACCSGSAASAACTAGSGCSSWRGCRRACWPSWCGRSCPTGRSRRGS